MNHTSIYGKGTKFDRINEVLKMYRNKTYMYIKTERSAGLLEALFLLLSVNINSLTLSLSNSTKYTSPPCTYFFTFQRK